MHARGRVWGGGVEGICFCAGAPHRTGGGEGAGARPPVRALGAPLPNMRYDFLWWHVATSLRDAGRFLVVLVIGEDGADMGMGLVLTEGLGSRAEGSCCGVDRGMWSPLTLPFFFCMGLHWMTVADFGLVSILVDRVVFV